MKSKSVTVACQSVYGRIVVTWVDVTASDMTVDHSSHICSGNVMDKLLSGVTEAYSITYLPKTTDSLRHDTLQTVTCVRQLMIDKGCIVVLTLTQTTSSRDGR